MQDDSLRADRLVSLLFSAVTVTFWPSQVSAIASEPLRREALDDPPLAFQPVPQAIVKAVRTALPEFVHPG